MDDITNPTAAPVDPMAPVTPVTPTPEPTVQPEPTMPDTSLPGDQVPADTTLQA